MDAALQLDPELLRLLLADADTRAQFFVQVDAAMVFNQSLFQQLIANQHFLPDSLTAYKNRIGLSDNGQFIADDSRVVLDFPYKDNVLVGGQARSEQRRQETFLHEIIAADAIDRLFEPKMLCHWHRVDCLGKHRLVPQSTQSPHTGIDVHRVIKGNNLIALHSLLPIYHGKVKLIYIDPPYNTGNDGFNYNDRFNHSAWLVFMKNRLSAARQLLRDDGVLYISCDDSEQAYLTVLCDEIFGRDNHVTSLVWRKKAGGANDSNTIAVEHEYILAYQKRDNGMVKMPLDAKTQAGYKLRDDKYPTHGAYKTKDLNDKSLSDSPGLHYDITCPDGSVLSAQAHQWKCNKKTFFERLADDRIVFKKTSNGWRVHYKIYLNEIKGKLNYDADGNILPRGRNLSSLLYDTALNKDGNDDIKRHFDGNKPFAYPKPVKLLETLIQSATRDGDIIMDFFAGSGTTGEAVIKLNAEQAQRTGNGGKRRFVLVEQMDYINDITLPRLQSSLALYNSTDEHKDSADNDSDNIYYAELQTTHDEWLARLHRAKHAEDYLALYHDLLSAPGCDYRVTDTLTGDDFAAMGAMDAMDNDTAEALLQVMIDKNLWYLPFSERDNGDFEVDANDKVLSEQFYGNGADDDIQ